MNPKVDRTMYALCALDAMGGSRHNKALNGSVVVLILLYQSTLPFSTAEEEEGAPAMLRVIVMV